MELYVSVQFFIEGTFMCWATADAGSRASQPGTEPSHDASPGDKNRARISIVCSHSLAARVSRFTPARVSW